MVKQVGKGQPEFKLDVRQEVVRQSTKTLEKNIYSNICREGTARNHAYVKVRSYIQSTCDGFL